MPPDQKQKQKYQAAMTSPAAALDLEAVQLRLMRDGVVTTYTMPPATGAVIGNVPAVGLSGLAAYCDAQRDTAENKLLAFPDSVLALHELAVFASLVRLIETVRASAAIKAELWAIHKRRQAAAKGEAEAWDAYKGEASAAPPADDAAEGNDDINDQ